MDEMVRLFVLAQGEFGERVAAVPADQWERPIVASAWTIGDLVDHLTEENRWVAPLLAGQSLEQAGDTVAKLSAEVDRQQAWRTAAAASAQAFAEPGALERSVALSRGATPASLYITEAVFDHTVHAWDLDHALGTHRPLPEDLVSTVYSILQPLGNLSELYPGLFDPPVAVPGDAPLIDKLVALTGRKPG